MRYDCIVFDLDGTLTDTVATLAFCCNATLEKYGFEKKSDEEVLKCVGYGVKYLLEHIMPADFVAKEAEFAEALKFMKAFYEEHYDYGISIYDGLPEFLDKCMEKGIKLAISTNKMQYATDGIVRDTLGAWKFEYAIGDNFSHPIKPDPYSINIVADGLKLDKSRILYVGDTEVDVKVARNAGVDVCSATWGFRSADILKACEPDYIIDHPSELERIVF